MAAQKGREFLVKAGDGATSEAFTTVASFRSNSITINDEIVDVTNKDSNGWRVLLANAGTKSATISGSGVFTDSATQIAEQAKLLAGTINNYELYFENGDKLAGAFQISSLEYAGDYNNEQTFSITYESSGAITYTAA